jgi:membrane-anchored protein YejM (alkaline phosphatase superfamily)
MKLKTLSLPQIISKYGRTSVFISKAGSTPQAAVTSGENTVQNIQVNTKNNKILIDKAIEVFNQRQPYFMGIRLIGGRGNKSEQAKGINTVDEQIGRLLAALRANGVYDQCLIAVTGNYGDIDNQFKQSNRVEDLMVPVIITGPGLKSGAVLPPVKITDIAPTIALLTGVQISPESNGLVLWNALRSGTGFIEENLLLKRVKDLSEENIKSFGGIYRLNEEKGLVKTEKENITLEKTIMQKTVEGKNAEIKTLKLKITFLKLVGIITVAVFGLGYAVEYYYLRKKFLMF